MTAVKQPAAVETRLKKPPARGIRGELAEQVVLRNVTNENQSVRQRKEPRGSLSAWLTSVDVAQN